MSESGLSPYHEYQQTTARPKRLSLANKENHWKCNNRRGRKSTLSDRARHRRLVQRVIGGVCSKASEAYARSIRRNVMCLRTVGAWTSVHGFHEEARHCQGRSEELSADGMFDRASIRTRWSSLRTRCSMKFDLAALLSLSRPLRTGRGLAVAANSVCPFALLRFLNLLQSDVLPQPPSIRRFDVPASIRRSFLRSGISRLTAATRVVGRRLVPVIPFPSYKSCSQIGPEQSRARRARRSEPWTARTDLESCQQRERGVNAK